MQALADFRAGRLVNTRTQPPNAKGSACSRRSRARILVPLRASSGDNDEPGVDKLKDRFFNDKSSSRGPDEDPGTSQRSIIDDVNPIQLGRQARQRFDAIWGSLTSLASPTKSYVFDDVLESLSEDEFPADSGTTTVLVAGATGQVGRILVRKLLLRGYKVRALVRQRQGLRESADGVPEAVEIVEGDVGEGKDCERAVRGVDKVRVHARVLRGHTRYQWHCTSLHLRLWQHRDHLQRLSRCQARRRRRHARCACVPPCPRAGSAPAPVARRVDLLSCNPHHSLLALQLIYCAAARSTFTGDLLRVDDRGVANLVNAFQVGVAAWGVGLLAGW